MGATATWNTCSAVVVLLSLLMTQSEETNPYATVSQRNIFGLREPVPPPPTPSAPVAQDSAELTLTGIADFRLNQWALLTRTERGQQPRRYTLKVGQQEDDLQVLAIDAEAGTVHVRNGAVEAVLAFLKAEDPGSKYVQQAKPFVDAHTRAHELREQREQERRNLERVAAAAELAAQKISTQQ